MADVDTALEQDVFNLAKRQRVAGTEGFGAAALLGAYDHRFLRFRRYGYAAVPALRGQR